MNIFADTELPRWMQELRKENSSLGESLGTVLAGGFLGLQKNEEGDGIKGLQQGMAEARMNQADPNWKVKEKLLEGQVMSNWAKAATEWQSLDMTNRDMAQWTTQDLPALSKYQEELKTNADANPPVMVSQRGQQALQSIETGRLRRATLDFKRDQAENMYDLQRQRAENTSEAAKAALEDFKTFNKTLATVTSPTARSQIRAMMKDGNPTPEAWAALDAAEKVTPEQEKIKGRIDLEKARGENRLAVEQVRADSKEDFAKLTFEQKQQFEEQRQADRAALENLKQKGRVDIQKMKDLSRTDATGKTLSRKEFINRHLNTFFTMLRKNAPDDESPSVTADKVEKLLSGLYYRVDKSEAAKAAAPATAAPAPAKPAAQATNDADPLGILK